MATSIFDEVETGYTTDHEVEFLFELAAKGKYGTLHTLRKVYQARSWEGEEMSVDPKRVLAMIDFILSRR